ncbi:MAG: phosphate/phosphite/phosphonate ABC transporter substrate-binding protein [Thalassovita sp.]
MAFSQAEAKTYSFGIVPQFEARKLAQIWAPIIQEIETRTGHKFEIVGSPKIPDFEQAFGEGLYDFAYMNPYHATLAAKAQGYRPLVRDGARQLFGVLVVHKDSPYASPKDLADQTIAFPAPNALGASLMIRADLTNQHHIGFRSEYVATHSSAYLNVVLGQAAAAGGVMGTLRAQPENIFNELRILHQTEKVAPHPIVAHPRVPIRIQEEVKRALLDLWQTKQGRQLLLQIPMREVIEANPNDYRLIEQLGLDVFVED